MTHFRSESWKTILGECRLRRHVLPTAFWSHCHSSIARLGRGKDLTHEPSCFHLPLDCSVVQTSVMAGTKLIASRATQRRRCSDLPGQHHFLWGLTWSQEKGWAPTGLAGLRAALTPFTTGPWTCHSLGWPRMACGTTRYRAFSHRKP